MADHHRLRGSLSWPTPHRGLVPLGVCALLVGLSACGDSGANQADRDRSLAGVATSAPSATPSAASPSPHPSPTASRTEPTARRAPALPPGDDGTVTGLTDGDTVRVDGDPVRLIGVDTPETRDPRRTVECFGHQAARATAELLPVGTRVRLVYDVERTDRYGRTLAYVYRSADGVLVNAELVRRGYAVPLTVPPNVAHADDFAMLARQARSASAGLWSACPAARATSAAPLPPPATAPPPPAPEPTAADTGQIACDPAYPDFCIPSAPPDLDCADIDGGSFTVLPPDPHGLDGYDDDGLGCESN